MFQEIQNGYLVVCEAPGCETKRFFRKEPNARMLQENGWSWLRGDEFYDHVCSQTCLTKFSKAEQHRENSRLSGVLRDD